MAYLLPYSGWLTTFDRSGLTIRYLESSYSRLVFSIDPISRLSFLVGKHNTYMSRGNYPGKWIRDLSRDLIYLAAPFLFHNFSRSY
jgi:hypothetical protein